MREALERVSAAIRDVREAEALAYQVSEIVGTLLAASRVGYSRLDSDQDTMITSRDWTASNVVSLQGRLPLSTYGSYIKELRVGAVVAVADVYDDHRTGEATALDQLHARAFLNVPVLENQVLAAVFFVNMPTVHDWSDNETTFFTEVADRLRVGAERLRIEAEREKLVDELHALNETLQQRVEAEVAARSLLATIVETTDVVILAADLNYNLLAINKAAVVEFERIYGTRPKVGDNMLDLLADQPEHHAQIREGWGRGLAGEESIFVEEYGAEDRDRPYYEIRFRTLRNAAGERVGAYQFVTNVTERLREQAQLADAREALRQSQKVEAIGQLTGGVAHDFNNLLTVIKSATEMLKRDQLSDERRQRYITAIGDTADRAAKLTAQLLAFARRQSLQPEVFAVCDSVTALSDMLATLIGSRIEIVTDLTEEAVHINADPSQFDTALVNMAVNARDAMDRGGRLTIAVRPSDAIPALRGSPARPGCFVAVSLSDNGEGIPIDMFESIFEPFFTTKELGKGTGLGLSQVFGFAKQSGGEVAVESEVGKGTTFTLYLPRAEAGAFEAQDRSEPEALIDGHGMCVLVVEDNADVGTFAVQTLADLGYETVLANTADEALNELHRNASRFDVVLSDVVMPGISGIELGQAIREHHADLPVVLTSGYSHVLAQNGTFGFELLQKPYSVEQLSRILRKAAAWQHKVRIRTG